MANPVYLKRPETAYVHQRMTSHQTVTKVYQPSCEASRNKLIIIAIGALIGFLLCMAYIMWIVTTNLLQKPATTQYPATEAIDNVMPNVTTSTEATQTQAVVSQLQDAAVTTSPDPVTSREQLYVGVLTLQPYLHTRARACQDTWGRNMADGTMEFYAEMTSRRDAQSPVKTVPLRGRHTTDVYHTEKSFLMLQHMCQEHGGHFDWFMRAVDDAYVDVARLRHLVSKLDPDKETLLGHPTMPIEDNSFQTLNGREYCLGGPGLLFSRALLKRVCPSLSACRHRLNDLPADVAIAKCVSDYTGVQCAFLPQLHNFFVHSFEMNHFNLLGEFEERASTAVTLHPLKQPWIMNVVHERVTRRHHNDIMKKLEHLKAERKQIETKLNLRGVKTDTRDVASPVNDNDVTMTYLSSDGRAYERKADGIQEWPLKVSEIDALKQAVRLANTSLTWGHSQRCDSLLSAVRIQQAASQQHVIDLQCQHRQDAEPTIARVTTSRVPVDAHTIKRSDWSTGSHVILVIKVQLRDVNFINYVTQLPDIFKSLGKTVIVNVIYESTPSSPSDVIRRSSHLDEDIVADLARWAHPYNIHIRGFKLSKHSHDIYRESLKNLVHTYDDAVVIFSDLKIKLSSEFLLRCLAVVREGKWLYVPHVPQQDASSMKHTDLVSSVRPVCVHIKDFLPETTHGRRRKDWKARSTPRVNTALDPDLKIYA